ncbi:MAG TPA: tetratricopeptide repeat protein [Gemmatimonadales bacterium]
MTLRPLLPLAWSILAQPAVLSAQTARPQAVQSADPLDTLLETADRHHYAGRLDAARETLARAETAARGAGPGGLARVWTARGLVWLSETTATNRGYPEADSAAARALELAERSGDSLLIADAAELAGRVLYSRRINLAEGDYDAPSRHFERALALRRAAADTGGIVDALFRVGLIHERKDEGDRAVALYQEGLRLAGSGYPLERSNLARHLGYQHLRRGDLDRALTYLQQSHDLREQAGFVLVRSPALASIGEVYRRKGDHARAREYVARALAEAERLEASRFVVQALIALGRIDSAAARLEQARQQWRRAETLAGEIGYVSGARQAREFLATAAR